MNVSPAPARIGQFIPIPPRREQEAMPVRCAIDIFNRDRCLRSARMRLDPTDGVFTAAAAGRRTSLSPWFRFLWLALILLPAGLIRSGASLPGQGLAFAAIRPGLLLFSPTPAACGIATTFVSPALLLVGGSLLPASGTIPLISGSPAERFSWPARVALGPRQLFVTTTITPPIHL